MKNSLITKYFEVNRIMHDTNLCLDPNFIITLNNVNMSTVASMFAEMYFSCYSMLWVIKIATYECVESRINRKVLVHV